jgi:hypothetical protein
MAVYLVGLQVSGIELCLELLVLGAQLLDGVILIGFAGDKPAVG